MKFEELPLDELLQKAVREVGYETPTPIQEKAIPPLLEGNDLMGIAQTGTGKTAAFALPILQKLIESGKVREPKCTRVLVLLPTRELAIQVADCFDKYSKYTGLSTTCVFGGVSDVPQKRALIRGVDILVATPGRLLDLINQRVISLKKLEYFVLDEADRMLDMGFRPQIEMIFRHVPRERQTMLFSATMPAEIMKLANAHMKLPIRIEVAPPGTTVKGIQQELFIVQKMEKLPLLETLLKEHHGSILVFSRTKHGARKIARAVNAMGHAAAEIHANRSLNQRREALQGFKTGRYRVLVATDIAARGIDVTGIEVVINFDLPDDPNDYVHRIGRTARAGREGRAISFATAEQKGSIRDIERLVRSTLRRPPTPPLPARPLSAPPAHPAPRFEQRSIGRPPFRARRRFRSFRGPRRRSGKTQQRPRNDAL